MASLQQLNTAFFRVFFADIVALHPQSERQYDCAGISDIHHRQPGVSRCLDSAETGREFLQYHADQNVADIDASHFFKALRSPRRLENLTSLNDLLATPMAGRVAETYARCRELDGWDIHAVDGHYHKACIDYRHWSRLKHTCGICFTTCEKSNSAAQVMGKFTGSQEKPCGLRMPGSQPAAVV